MRALRTGRKAPSGSSLIVLAALLAMGTATTAGCARDRAARRGPEHPAAAKPDKYVETVSARAPFDLSCPADQVQVVRLSESALGATGCGRQTSYACLCTYHILFSCTQAVCSLDGSNVVQPPVLQGQPPPSTPEPLPPT